MLVAKYGDHLPLYRLQKNYARDGLALARSTLARSTLAQWVGQCGVQLQRLPTHKASQIGQLLPHRWRPACA